MITATNEKKLVFVVISDVAKIQHAANIVSRFFPTNHLQDLLCPISLYQTTNSN